MAEQNGIYKCEICGNVVSVIEAHEGELVCCGQPMKLLEEKTKEQEGKEKHVPIVEINGNNVKVKVGEVPHPMEAEHYIELIQITKDGKVIEGARLNPEDRPEAEFCLESTEGIKARELCNIHGLWVSE
ncbi:desulfoferrodoxin [Candidatus Woesearchaeota archaeon]|nr:desulfoferrodoxin [Candidatus Woesearchaeota archaeon]